ncbi:hypothetical protein [Herbaspirillum sp. NPDC101396]
MKGLRFDIETRARGLRIYARLEHDIIGALDVEDGEVYKNGRTNAIVIYVVPRWRGNGIEESLRAHLARHLLEAPCSSAPLPDA